MSSSAFVFGANGYIGFGVCLALRRLGFRVYGAIRNSQHSSMLIKNEIEPVIAHSFDNTSVFTEKLAECSVIIDAVGINHTLSEIILQAAMDTGQQRTENGKFPQYAPLFLFTSTILPHNDRTKIIPRPTDETVNIKAMIYTMQNIMNFESRILNASSSIIHTAVIRPGTVYGGRGGVFIPMFYAENPAVIAGRRDKRWTWVHIDDLAEGYALVARAPRAVVSGQVWNFAAPHDTPTYDEVRTAMARVHGQNIEYKEELPNELFFLEWEADAIVHSSKAMDQLGWRPRHIGFIQEIETYYKAWLAHK